MPRQRQNPDTRDRLLEAGVAAFLENGYHGAGLKEVLDRVQVPKGSFYNYFKSKEEFGAATIRHYANSLSQKMAGAMAGARDPLSGLRRFFHRLMADFEAADYVGGCLVANLGGEVELNQTCRLALAEALYDWRAGVTQALRQAQEQGQVRNDIAAEELADVLINTWEGAVIRMKIERSLAPLRQCLHRLLDDYFQPVAG
ncbi:TetR family transcriptional regulator [candidate division KSB1 bacterium]|nr:MAG: TetR family transcriptional regulator [candidate division KSB1 bacterium]MCE7942469.1 TetR family transcriptional regulator [Chlorobi bacterium CHB1]MDL1877189.1 TetR family transcriptional regulator [Cytophagia bacterium CHB2]